NVILQYCNKAILQYGVEGLERDDRPIEERNIAILDTVPTSCPNWTISVSFIPTPGTSHPKKKSRPTIVNRESNSKVKTFLRWIIPYFMKPSLQPSGLFQLSRASRLYPENVLPPYRPGYVSQR